MQSTTRTAMPMLHPVPRSVADWVRTMRTRPTINDMVEHYHLQLLANEAYTRLFDAIYNEQAVEGSLVSDDHEAARMVRDSALRDDSPLGREKLATIVKALRVVLRRYEMARNQRRGAFADHNGGSTVEVSENDIENDV